MLATLGAFDEDPGEGWVTSTPTTIVLPQHVVTAISAPSSQWITDYQRYEFFGDSVLKFTVSCQLFGDHGNWHGGYPSERRNNLVSNMHLARAALSTGLDAFIMTEPVKGRKRSPMLISEVQNHSPDRRNISTKVLADVVEALIGAAFVDGGFHVARACIHTFLPSIRIQIPEFEVPVCEQNLCNAIIKVEPLIGHQFHNKALLLEALTHPSCDRDIHTESYQRLEFLGDAVLDMLVVSLLAEHKPERSQGEMTQIKAALVNANLLGFLCLESSYAQDVVSIQEAQAGIFKEKHGVEQVQLYKFMRHHRQEITKTQETCLERYKQLHEDIRRFLDRERAYPWVLLARLNPDKFYSDIVESVLGAIFVDSQGDLAGCRHFIERIGIAPYIRRAMVECIDVGHPRNVLERLAGSDKVQYAVDCEENSHGAYRCAISINEVEIVEVKGCLTKDESIVVASDAAIKFLSCAKAQ